MYFKMSYTICFNLDQKNTFNPLPDHKILWSGNGLNLLSANSFSLDESIAFSMNAPKCFVIWERINPFPNDKF